MMWSLLRRIIESIALSRIDHVAAISNNCDTVALSWVKSSWAARSLTVSAVRHNVKIPFWKWFVLQIFLWGFPYQATDPRLTLNQNEDRTLILAKVSCFEPRLFLCSSPRGRKSFLVVVIVGRRWDQHQKLWWTPTPLDRRSSKYGWCYRLIKKVWHK